MPDPPAAPASEALHMALQTEQRRSAELTARLKDARASCARAKRLVPSADPLRHVLPLRRAEFLGRSRSAADVDRENRLRAASPAYVRHLDATDTIPMKAITLEGLTWWVPLSPVMPDRAERVQKQGLPLEAILHARELSVGGVTLDVGANLGQTSIPRVLLGDAGVVYAAEAEEANFACLVRNVKDNAVQGVVLPDHVAIGSKNGSVRLARFPGIKTHSVEPVDLLALGEARAARVIDYVEVPCRTLDSWLDALGVDAGEIRFVKVDTNGYELEVLAGAPGLLARGRAAWQLEIAPQCLQSYGVGLPALIDALRRHFTHFIDLNAHLDHGARVRPIAEVAEGLAYLPDLPSLKKVPVTDILVYRAAASAHA
jgi:FkbM family methyltransferase